MNEWCIIYNLVRTERGAIDPRAGIQPLHPTLMELADSLGGSRLLSSFPLQLLSSRDSLRKKIAISILFHSSKCRQTNNHTFRGRNLDPLFLFRCTVENKLLSLEFINQLHVEFENIF